MQRYYYNLFKRSREKTKRKKNANANLHASLIASSTTVAFVSKSSFIE
jgi:hypothetical protein